MNCPFCKVIMSQSNGKHECEICGYEQSAFKKKKTRKCKNEMQNS